MKHINLDRATILGKVLDLGPVTGYAKVVENIFVPVKVEVEISVGHPVIATVEGTEQIFIR